MARRTEQPAEYTLYDIDPEFQERVLKWLSKKNIVIDIGTTPEAFVIGFDPGGEIITDSIESAINETMGSRSRAKRIDPEMEQRIHSFLDAKGAHLTFGAAGNVFNVVVSSADSTGKASDEDMELAIVLAEESFWDNMPAHVLAPKDRAALEHAVMRGPAQHEEEMQEQLHRALFVPRPELEANKRRLSYAPWLAEVQESLTPLGASTQDAPGDYWRQLFRAGFAPYEASQEFLETAGSGEYAENVHPMRSVSRAQRPSTFGKVPPPPSSRLDTQRRIERMIREEEKPFDPAAPREHYASPHHFAVNPLPGTKRFMVMRRTTRMERGQRVDELVLVNRSAHGFMSLEEARAWAEHNHTGPYEIYPYVAGSEEDPRMWESSSLPQSERTMHRRAYGSWRIRVAGDDIDPTPFFSETEAREYAQQKYGVSGWDAEWHAVS